MNKALNVNVIFLWRQSNQVLLDISEFTVGMAFSLMQGSASGSISSARLHIVKDHDGNIIKRYDYNYKLK